MERMEQITGWRRQGDTRQHQQSTTYSSLPTTLPSDTSESTLISDPSPTHPSLSKHLADFTLGFADGLTVPFALTAGLSSLGTTNTVIFAGTAELCAGCISMGIGGYLAAKGEERRDAEKEDGDDEESEKGVECGEQRDIQEYLAPLQLPADLLRLVTAHIESCPDIHERVRMNGLSTREPDKISPVMSGLSVALGYLLGGLLPLTPYFFVRGVANGVRWSFGICLVALFIFGFSKEYVLQVKPSISSRSSIPIKRRLGQWTLVKPSLLEGLRMVILGGIAAVAAVLCVKLFESLVSDAS
ncbi:Ccc1 family [Xylariaceae sp. FL1272]|nr:Ccc1 family [Xylariaceae sp. FL1272]